jgi:NDP-sugar pyrophosphorylase family protein
VDRIIVVVNYLAEQIEAYLAEQRHSPHWTAVRQVEPKGTGDALRSCQSQIKSDRFFVLNGDDLYGAADLATLANYSTGLLVHEVDEPRKFGIAFVNPDGTLQKLVEKPNLDGRRLANAGVYLFPKRVFDIELKLSPRGEYEITDYVSTLAALGQFQAVPAKFWLPIGTVEAWEAAQKMDLEKALTRV